METDTRDQGAPALDADHRALGLECRPATDFNLREIAGLFTLGFEGSVVPVQMTPRALSLMIRRDSLDLAASRVFVKEGHPVGFILMCSRGWSRRVSGMGVVASYRRKGLGHLLVESVIRDATDDGFRRIVLEVLDRNDSGIKLYRDLGFAEIRRLVGYEKPPSEPSGTSVDILREMDPRELAKVVEYEAPSDLPWQLSAETTAAAGPPDVALRLGDKAYALVSGITGTEATLNLILVPHALRRQGWGLKLTEALTSRYAGKRWRIPICFPENLAPEFFLRAGFAPLDLGQVEMALEIR